MPVEVVVAERIDPGALAKVQRVPVTLTTGQSSQTVLITPVDITCPLVISSAEQVCGQGTGSNDSAWAEVPDISAHLELTAFDRVTVTRGGTNGNLLLAFDVVELTP